MAEENYEQVHHTFAPVYDKDAKILILGSFPSVKSREQQFYYGHPNNRFWKMTAQIFGVPLPQSIGEKKTLLLDNYIALWDVIASCEIIGSSDASIRNVVPNDIGRILAEAKITKILANGTKAYELYKKYVYPDTGADCIKMPSTSPANAAWSLPKLVTAWEKQLLDDCGMGKENAL